MKILFIHSSGDLYGSGKIMLYAIDALKSEGHECIVCIPEEGPIVKELESRDCKIYIQELGILRRKYQNLFGLINRTWALLLAIINLNKIIKIENIGLVYSNTTAVICGALSASLKRKKHIWHIHEIIESPRIFAKFLSFMIQEFSTRAIAVSKPVKKHWDSISNISSKESKIQVIHNGLPLTEFDVQTSLVREELNLEDSDIIIGMVGRVHHWKGQGYFLEMANHLRKKYINLKFIMVGDAFPGYEYIYEELEELKLKYDLNEVVFDLGFRTDVPSLMKGFDIFVLPSTLPDPLPTVVLEAMGMNLPVIATKHGGALEMVVHAKTGFHIPWDNPKEAVHYVEKLVNNSDLRLEFGKSGRKRLEKMFSIQTFKKNISDLITNIFV